MKEDLKYCEHCGQEYVYIVHGGWPTSTNDSKYCSECMSVMLESLKSIPKKFRFVSVDASDEITLDELISLENQYIEFANKNHKLYVSKSKFGLIFDGDSNSSRVILDKNNTEYWLTEYQKFNEYTISRIVYWNISENCAVKEWDKKPTELKILINPNKSKVPPKPMNIKGVVPMNEPLGLGYVLRNQCNYLNGGL